MTRIRSHPMAALSALVAAFATAFVRSPRKVTLALQEDQAAVA